MTDLTGAHRVVVEGAADGRLTYRPARREARTGTALAPLWTLGARVVPGHLARAVIREGLIADPDPASTGMPAPGGNGFAVVVDVTASGLAALGRSLPD